jgi:hypothetical protein
LAPVVLEMRKGGFTLAQIADALNEQGWRTRRGKEWTDALVCLLLKQLA